MRIRIDLDLTWAEIKSWNGQSLSFAVSNRLFQFFLVAIESPHMFQTHLPVGKIQLHLQVCPQLEAADVTVR